MEKKQQGTMQESKENLARNQGREYTRKVVRNFKEMQKIAKNKE